MPYIKLDQRKLVNIDIENLADKIDCKFTWQEQLGVMNYVITRLLLRVFGRGSYMAFVFIIGTLGCVALEYYRRAAGPYEDQKREENGEVYY